MGTSDTLALYRYRSLKRHCTKIKPNFAKLTENQLPIRVECGAGLYKIKCT
jgi:hypothetical protein